MAGADPSRHVRRWGIEPHVFAWLEPQTAASAAVAGGITGRCGDYGIGVFDGGNAEPAAPDLGLPQAVDEPAGADLPGVCAGVVRAELDCFGRDEDGEDTALSKVKHGFPVLFCC